MGCDETATPRQYYQRAKNHRSCFRVERLQKQLQDRHTSRSTSHLIEVLDAKQHANAEGPGRDETNANCTEDRNRNDPLWIEDLFCHMSSAIETVECPIRVDQAHNEGHSVAFPAGVVDKRSENEASRFL